jgi:hypothetical protein
VAPPPLEPGVEDDREARVRVGELHRRTLIIPIGMLDRQISMNGQDEGEAGGGCRAGSNRRPSHRLSGSRPR